uniref:Myb-like domain-containing protein n=2 Tax=Ciona intestinalis TaxID=7719 RepID=F6RZS3_CIOIN
MMSPAKKTTTSKKTTENTKSADVTIPLLEQNQVSVKQHLEIRRRQKSRFFNNNDKIINNKNNEKLVSNNNQQSRCLTFTLNQTRTLKLQLKQHVQLLTQINLLSKNKPEFHKITSEALAMLKEIKQLGKHQKAELRIEASCFDVEHLNDALDITQLKLSSSEPVVNLTKFERNRRMFPLSRQIATVMSQSPVFCYTHLLPACGGLKVNPDTVRKTYSFSVDILLCLGLAQMEGHLRPMYELIHQYMLPTMSPDQIKFRVKNAMNCHYGQNNPIYIYHRTKVIPQPPIISDPDVGPSTGIPNHLGLKSAPIPDWLHMLQLEDSNHSTSTLDNSNQEPQDKYAVLINNPGDPSTSKPPTAIILPIIYNNESSGKKKIKRQDWVRNIRTPIANKRKKSQKKEQKVKKPRTDSEIAKKLKSNSSPTQMEVLNTSNTSFETQPENDETVALNSTNESQDSEPSTNQMALSDKDKVDQLNENISPEKEISENNLSDNINSSLSKVTSDKNFSVPKSVGLKMAEQIETSPAAKKVESVGQKVPQSQTKKVRTENISSKNSTKLSKKSNKNKIDSNKILSPSLKKKNRSSDVGCDDEVGGTEEDEEETEDEQMHVEDAPTEEEEQKEEKSKKRKKAKCRAKISSTKLGGRLHRTFPCLGSKKNSGKSRNSASDDQFSKNLRKSAEKVKLLEEDTIVQLDPTRVEKEMLFAEGYLKQLQTVLKDKPDVLIQVLEIMSEFALDAGLSPPILFKKISELLSPWPQLIQGFAPFLLPEQAHACGLLPEQQVYARARKFLRQLEIRFQDNPQHLNRIINTFKSVAESAVYKENEMKSNILTMLKSDPYLQEEFLMFFDNERPPESRLNGDWEEIYWTDDLLKESGAPAGFEEIHVPFSGEGNPLSGTEEANISSSTKFPVSNKQKPTVASNNQSIKKPRRVSKCKTKDKNREDWNLHPRLGVEEEEEDGLTQPPNTASTTAIQHADVGVISEDALSCNSQHNEDGVSISVNKPPTPTGTQASQDSVSLSDYKLAPDLHSSSHGSSLPITPTGSRSPKSEDQLQDQAKDVDTALQWTREDDATLLGHCKLDGATEQTFSKVASVLKRSKEEIENRFQTLINLISGGDVTDTESVYTDGTEAEDLSD